MEWKNIYRGMIIGGSNVVPGISGGTIALLLGIYDRLLESIDRLFSKDWKQQLNFLIPLGIGMVIAILLLASGLEWLFEFYPRPTLFAFIGLIIGALPFLLKESEAKAKFNYQHILLLIVGIIMVIALNSFQGNEEFIITEKNLTTYAFLMFAGFISGATMILPGVSGSLILLVIGAYGTVIQAVAGFEIDILAVVAIGIGLGVIMISKVLSFLFSHYPYATYAVIIGLVVGSIYVLFPGWPRGVADTALSSLALIFGLIIAYLLGRVEHQSDSNQGGGVQS